MGYDLYSITGGGGRWWWSFRQEGCQATDNCSGQCFMYDTTGCSQEDLWTLSSLVCGVSWMRHQDVLCRVHRNKRWYFKPKHHLYLNLESVVRA